MKNSHNYYQILHVQPDAPREIIKASYRTIMQKLKIHPDLGGDVASAVILNEAYAILSNRKKRAEYDQKLQRATEPSPPSATRKRGRDKVNKPGKRKVPEYWKDQSVCPFCGTPKPASEYDNDSTDCNRCNTPLKKVVRLVIAGKSRRKIQRVSNGAPIRFYTYTGMTTAKPGIIRDLSPQGMQFTTAIELGSGQVIRIVSDLLTASARICYCRHDTNTGQYAIGVQFLTLKFHHMVGTFLSESA